MKITNIRNTLYFIGSLFMPAIAFAEAHGGSGQGGLIAIGIGFAIGAAAVGGALGQGKLGAAAMEGLARNPQARDAMFTPMIIGLVLIESLVLYAFVIAFLGLQKI